MWEWPNLEDWHGVGVGLLLILAGLSGRPVYARYGLTLFQKPVDEKQAKVVRGLFLIAGAL